MVASPCISICTINSDSGLCDGCFRTLDEIAVWSQMDNGAKREVWSAIALRSAQAKAQAAQSTAQAAQSTVHSAQFKSP